MDAAAASTPLRARLRAAPWVWAGAAYLALALLALAPALGSFARAVPGSTVAGADGWQNVWNMWWTHRAIAEGANPFFTRIIFYPQGADLTGQTLTITNGLLALPVTALFGPVAGYNFAVVLSFVLTGLGGYALTREVTGRPWAAFVGGLVLAFGPFHMTKVWDGQLELIALQWLPLYVLFLVRAAGAGGRRRDALLAGLLLAVVGYTSWYYLYFMALASLLAALLWLPWQAGWRPWAAALLRLAAAAVVAGLILAPALGSLLRSALAGTGPSASAGLLPERSATLVDFWLPSYLHPVLGEWVLRLGSPWHTGVAAWNVSLGYTPVLLALVALWRAPGAAWRWVVLAVAACVLALGPTLAIGPWQTGLPMPYAALAALPGGNLSHRPGHFVVIACVALAPLAGLGLSLALEWAGRGRQAPLAAQERGAAPRQTGQLSAPSSPSRGEGGVVAGLSSRQLALLAAVLLALGWEFLPPRWGLWEPVTHPYYLALAEEPGALLVLPAAEESMRPLIDQVRHGRALVGGMLARAPSYDPPRAPGVRDLWRPDVPRPYLLAGDRDQGLAALNYYGVGQIVIDLARIRPVEAAALDGVLAWLLPGAPPRFEDADLRVYDVPAAPPRAFAFFRSGWYREERDGGRGWRWMRAQGEIVLVNPAAAHRPVALSLSVESYREPREAVLAFGGHPAGTLAIPAQPGRVSRTLHLLLPPGETSLTLEAPLDPQPAPDNRMLSIVLTDAVVRQRAEE